MSAPKITTCGICSTEVDSLTALRGHVCTKTLEEAYDEAFARPTHRRRWFPGLKRRDGKINKPGYVRERVRGGEISFACSSCGVNEVDDPRGVCKACQEPRIA